MTPTPLLLASFLACIADPSDDEWPTLSSHHDLAIAALFVGVAEGELYDENGRLVASTSADATTDDVLVFSEIPSGSYYLDVSDWTGQSAYGAEGQLRFAPMVVDGDAALVEGPFMIEGIDHALLMLDVGVVADAKAWDTSYGSTSARLRVTWEASYAMGGDFASACNSATSCWNYSSSSAYGSGDYVGDDSSAWSTMRSRYGKTTGYASCKDGGSATCYMNYGSGTLSDYAYQATTDATTTKRYRGGQCKFFQNLVLYRSGIYTKTLPSDSTISASSATYPTATTSSIAVGDVLRKPSGHSVIVVAYDSGTKKALVVDSNWLSGDGHEAIGAHTLSYSSGSTSTSYWSSYRDLDCVYASSPCGS